MSTEAPESRGGGGNREGRPQPSRHAMGHAAHGEGGGGGPGPNAAQQPPDFGSSWRSNALAGGNNPLAAGMAEAAFNNYYFSGGYSPFSGDIRESIAAIWSRTSPSTGGEGVSAPFSGGYGQFSADSSNQFAANSNPTGQFAANLTGHFAGSEMSMFSAGGDFPTAAAAAAYGQQYGYGPQYSQWPESGSTAVGGAMPGGGGIGGRNGHSNLMQGSGAENLSSPGGNGYNYLSKDNGANSDRMNNLGQGMDNMKLSSGMNAAPATGKRGGESNGYSSASAVSSSTVGSGSSGGGSAPVSGQPKKMSWASVASQPAKPVTLAPKAKKPGVLPPPAMIPSTKPLNPMNEEEVAGLDGSEEVVAAIGHGQEGAVGSPAPPVEGREPDPVVAAQMPFHQVQQQQQQQPQAPMPNYATNKQLAAYGGARSGVQEGGFPPQHLSNDQGRDPMMTRNHGMGGGAVTGHMPPGGPQGPPRSARQNVINGRGGGGGGGGGGSGGGYAGNDNRGRPNVNQYVPGGNGDPGLYSPMGGNYSSGGSYSSKPHPILESLKSQNEYNPRNFDMNPKSARFFVIKSFSEDDIHRSIKYEIWCSTDHGNKRLDAAFKERNNKGPIYLFFSVNGSGHFCGIAQMLTGVDYNSTGQSVWVQDKFKGQFKVKWIYVKDVPNGQLRHIRLENNENKPVTNSRDTQEVPPEKGKMVLKVIHGYKHQTSIFDDFVHYEKRQEEEDCKKQTSGAYHGNGDRSGNEGHREGGRHGGKFRGHHLNQGSRR